MKRSPLAAAALLLLGAGPAHPVLLDDQAWTEPSAAFAHDLTHAPPECLSRPGDAALAAQIEIGRALFRSPTLLGGPASRLGLSCNACHLNGHSNAHFFLPELTDRPGAADVTAEWASAIRGDGIMNPVPIPDLTGLSAKAGFGHKHEPSLARFITSVIEEEFQGEAPPPQAFGGILAYLRALDPRVCPKAAEEALTVRSAAEEVRRPLAAAPGADAATARLLLLAAQEALGRLAERLPPGEFGAGRKTLEELARELGAMRDATRLPEAGWTARFDAVITEIAEREDKTYFREAVLRRALTR